MMKHLTTYRSVLVIIVLSLLPIISIFLTPQLIHTHDGLVHLPRLASYYQSLVDGQIPPRFAGGLNYGYGVPLFIFMYHTPYIIGSLLLLFGLTLIDAFKVSLTLSYILSGVFMYGFARAFFNDEKKAMLVTLLYQFAPFRFVELLVRGSFGEVYTYTFLPLVLWFLMLLTKSYSIRRFIGVSVASGLLILSHNSISLVFFSVVVFFAMWFIKDVQKRMVSMLAVFAGMLLAAFYWIPALIERRYTYGDLHMRDVFRDHFASLSQFFTPNITNNRHFFIEGISVDIGIIHLIVLLTSAYLLFIKKNIRKDVRKLIVFCFILVVGAFFFMQPLSLLLWERISILRQFQFPWRFLAVIVFATSLLGVVLFEFSWMKKRLIYTSLLVIIVAITAWCWKPVEGYDSIDEKYYWNFPLNTTYYGEADVMWSEGPAKGYPPETSEVIDGNARIQFGERRSNLHTYTVEASTPVTIVDHTQYFPGWRVYVDEEKVPIEFQDINWRGQITFNVPQGEHRVRVVFGRSKIRLLSEILSGATSIILGILWLVEKKHPTKK